ncbi:tRNA(Arg) A34 adenosine deaminase TadA [Dongia mobilis]|uniref:tRNA-specific adenosine deaminase n=1 Tax=Dongia mobilis TaxID=578943 RepID=A0A4R6WFP4_9PROT|nr:nucleoside deaminase [Dongia mobilis]TDQ78820.1 tRNA(Arg) A34 adenosine deaminase TadA [Dongia mobilis]
MTIPHPHPVDFMELALRQAEAAAARAEVPVGAVLVDPATGEVLAADHNRVEEWHDPTAHAEMLVIRAVATSRREKRLPFAELYVTLEPCAMCAAAISFARLRRVHFAAPDPKGGGVLHGGRFFEQPTCHHRPEISGPTTAEAASAELLRGFFRARR